MEINRGNDMSELLTKKAVVVFSGGLDSATCLYYVRSLGYEVHAVSFNYGQRHKKELDFAKDICKDLGLDHKIVDMTNLNELLQGSALTTDSIDVPHGHYAADNMKLTVVPNRNAIMLSIATGYAVSKGAEAVFAGMHEGDHFIYPDCRPEFIESFDVSMGIANQGFGHPKLRIRAPFLEKTKAEIVKIGSILDVPFEKTWSCYEGGEIHCGLCGTCQERREAFENAKVKDPTKYKNLEPLEALEVPCIFD